MLRKKMKVHLRKKRLLHLILLKIKGLKLLQLILSKRQIYNYHHSLQCFLMLQTPISILQSCQVSRLQSPVSCLIISPVSSLQSCQVWSLQSLELSSFKCWHCGQCQLSTWHCCYNVVL